MGSTQWHFELPKIYPGRFYQHPVDGVIRMITGNQPEMVAGRNADSGYYTWEVVNTGEKRTAVPGPMEEVDAEKYRSMLLDRLEDYGVASNASNSALRLSLLLLTLDREVAAAELEVRQQAAAAEQRLRRERYNAPLDQPLPAAVPPRP